MTFQSLSIYVVAFLLLETPAVAENTSISLEGRWRADFARSSNPYSKSAKSALLEIVVDDGKTLECKETIIREDGRQTVEVMTAPVDGKFYPVAGSRHGLLAAVTHRAPGSVTLELRAPNGLHASEVCNLSPDAATLICEEADTDLSGRTSSSRSVYVRD